MQWFKCFQLTFYLFTDFTEIPIHFNSYFSLIFFIFILCLFHKNSHTQLTTKLSYFELSKNIDTKTQTVVLKIIFIMKQRKLIPTDK